LPDGLPHRSTYRIAPVRVTGDPTLGSNLNPIDGSRLQTRHNNVEFAEDRPKRLTQQRTMLDALGR